MVNKGRHTNASQFYITLQSAPYLDKKYVAFGYVHYRFFCIVFTHIKYCSKLICTIIVHSLSSQNQSWVIQNDIDTSVINSYNKLVINGIRKLWLARWYRCLSHNHVDMSSIPRTHIMTELHKNCPLTSTHLPWLAHHTHT